MISIIEFSENLQSELKGKLSEASSANQSAVVSAAMSMTIARDCVSKLDEFLISYKFPSQQEEIRFYKEYRPVIVSQYLYYTNAVSLARYELHPDNIERDRAYLRMLAKLEQYVRKNWIFYTYILSGSTLNDATFFTRKGIAECESSRYPFGESYDKKLARILSDELTAEYIRKKLTAPTRTEESYAIKWTASKTSLIELGLALHAAGTFENGNADLRHVISALGRLFQIDLEGYYRIYVHIKNRKKAQTVFIDQLKEKLQQRINESFE